MKNKKAFGWGLVVSALFGMPYILYRLSGLEITWLDSALWIIGLPCGYALLLFGFIFQNVELHDIAVPGSIIYIWALGFFVGYCAQRLSRKIMSRKKGRASLANP